MASERLGQLNGHLAANKASNIVIDGKSYDTGSEPKFALDSERAKTNFDITEMRYFINGGKERSHAIESFMQTVERDPIFDNRFLYDLDHEERRRITMARVGRIAQYTAASKSEDEARLESSIFSLADPSAYTRCGVHYGLFVSGIRGSGTAEQFQYWISQGAGTVQNFAGCFGMTELGHGSNVAGVETTATFDEQTDEFIINTPHVAATKWWIGGAAHTATHCLVYARLIVKGKDYGVKNFVVPLRNVNDHTLLLGVAVGDIGKKMGRDGIDNGWIQFTNVRIPRQYMCMRYDKVDKHGNVTQPPLAQLSYGALVGGRVSMVEDSYMWSKRFVTIAIRYAGARRQFSSNGDVETKLLDYRYHQRRLIPRLAYTYAMGAASQILGDVYKGVTKSLAKAGQAGDKQALNKAIEDSKELFGLSAGLKAFATWATADTIDQCRQACGGQGYSAYNGFGPGYNDWVVQCTWEGDNNVLTLSTGRALIQTALKISKGKTPGAVTEYLTRFKELSQAKLAGRDIRDAKILIEAFEAAAAKAVFYATSEFTKHTKDGLSKGEAFEAVSQLRFDAARLHTRQFFVRAFFEKIERYSSPSIKPALLDLAILFGLWSIEQDIAFFLRSGYFSTTDAEQVTRYVDDYCLKVREQAIGLTDSFGLSDFFINSAIGKYDGDIYNNILNGAKSHDKFLEATKPDYYKDTMVPVFTRVEPSDPNLTELGDLN